MKATMVTYQAQEFAGAAARDFGKQLRSFLRRWVRHDQDVDDLAQEVYLRLLRVSSMEAIRDPLAYVLGVAAHVASEFNLRKRRARVVFDSSVFEATLDTQTNVRSQQRVDGGSYFLQNVADTLSRLSDKQLAVLLLERRNGLSHEQIAEKLGLSVHTVKKYGVQALALVRASLEN